jgi:ribulose-5-phosphate 4-epimerase/fuculose-1-phosphate aldolase
MVTAADALVRDLVIANRVLYAQGVVDAFGHVSVRHDADPRRFLLARNMAPGSVRGEDILKFDLDGNALQGGDRGVYLERFIHGQIYRSRPDVTSVVHSHSHAVVPFSVLPSVPLRPLWHMSGFIPQETPIFEIRDFAGDASDLLISSNALGQDLATVLGAATLVLMRGHGATVVGATLPEAVYRAVYTQKNAELQLHIIGHADAVYLTPGEAAATVQSIRTQIDRAWNLWKAEASV